MDSDTDFILSSWVVPLWLTGKKTWLILKAKDVTVKVLGIRFHGLTMRNEMTCTGTPPGTQHESRDVPPSLCYPNDPKGQVYNTQVYPAICESGAHSIAPSPTPAPTTAAPTTAAPSTTAAPTTGAPTTKAPALAGTEIIA